LYNPKDKNFLAEFLPKVATMGLFAYSLEQSINILEFTDEKEIAAFTKDFNTPTSIIAKTYQRGADRRLYKFEAMLLKAAEAGDKIAQAELEDRIQARVNANTKS